MFEQQKKVSVTAIVIGVAGFIVSVIIAFVIISNISDINEDQVAYGDSFDGKFLYTTPVVVDTHGVTNFKAEVYNDTWMDCDGLNDYLQITPSSNDTVAFWYNSSTLGTWAFAVNSLGTTYLNAVEFPLSEYPVYWDGSDYFFCKTDATTFWAGQIDKITIYDGQLTAANVTTLYSEGRL
jgi:hypothetical protein